MGKFEKGTIFDGRFEVLGQIGVGGMAVVYEVRPLDTDRTFALKVLSQKFLDKNPREAERNLRRFKREAEILAMLKGARHVVELMEHGQAEDGSWFILMELLRGEELRRFIGRGSQVMGIGTFLQLAGHLVEGLKEIHERGIIHRDLAPDNVIVLKTEAGGLLPKYLDFGIGKSVVGELDQVTQMVTIMGKPNYFSPEQARGQEQTKASDVYSMGVVLYEMLTGHVPLRIMGVPDFRKIQRDPPAPLSSFREAQRVPEELRDVIMACLEKKPEDRPELDALIEQIERAKGRVEAGEIQEDDDHTPLTADATIALDLGPEAPLLKAGDLINRFEIKSVLGKGGMGAVYLAWDPVLHREVAIKVATRVAEDHAKKDVLREARASSALQSENIVTIYDAGTEGGTPYIAMEYVSGPTLKEVIEEQGNLTGPAFHEAARDILMGLIEAHEKGLTHRDLKPGNILKTRGGAYKITDFGIAQVASSREAVDREEGGAGVGTASIMSPEQADGKPVDQRSDIYSLGCVFYMMATGRGPFQGNAIAQIYQHCTATPDPPSKVNPDLTPPELDRIILKCLEKDPADRYQSAEEVLEDLEEVFRPLLSGTVPWYRSKTGIAMMALILILLGALPFLGSGEPSGPESFGFSLGNVGRFPFEEGRPTYYARTPDLRLIGTAEDPRARIRVTISREGSDHVETVTLACNDEAAFDGNVPIPALEAFGAGAKGPLRVRVEVEGDPEERFLTFVLIHDEEDPRLLVRNRTGPFEPVESVTIRTLRPEDLVFRFEDAISGFPAEEEGAAARHRIDLRLSAQGSEWSAPGVSIRRKGDQLEIEAVDLARNTYRDRIEIAWVDPRVEPLEDLPIAEDFLTREQSVVLRVRVDTSPISTREQPLEELFARVQDHKELGVRLVHEKDDVYSGRLDLPEPEAGEGLISGVFLEYAGRRLGEPGKPAFLVRQDPLPPLITLVHRLADGSSEVFTSGTETEVPTIRLIGSTNLAALLELSVRDEGPLGWLGRNPRVEISFRKNMDEVSGGTFALPAGGALGFPAEMPPSWVSCRVTILARDAAGNEARLPFDLVATDVRISPVATRTARAHGGEVYLHTTEGVALAVSAANLPEKDRLYLELRDDEDRPLTERRIPFERGEGGEWIIRDLGLDASRVRTAHVYNTSEGHRLGSELSSFKVIVDTAPPLVTVEIKGLEGVPPSTLTVGHLPRMTVTITDNTGVDAEACRVTWSPSGPTPERRIGGDGRTLELALPADSSTSTRGTHEVTVEARDLAGNSATPWKMKFELHPPTFVLERLGGKLFEDLMRLSGSGVHLADPCVEIEYGNAAGKGTYLVRAEIQDDGGERKTIPLAPISGEDLGRIAIELPGRAGRLRLQQAETFDQTSPATEWKVFQEIEYVIDGADPIIHVLKDGVLVPPQQLKAGGLRVSRLSELEIVVNDDMGLGGTPLLVGGKPAAEAGLERVKRGKRETAYRLRDEPAWQEKRLALEARDLAGRTQRLDFRILRARDLPEVTAFVKPDGERIPPRAMPEALKDSRLEAVVEIFEARDIGGIRLEVERADAGSELISRNLDRTDDHGTYKGTIDFPAEGTYLVRFFFRKGVGGSWQVFKTQTIRVDRSGPRVSLSLDGRTLGSVETEVRPPAVIKVSAADPCGVKRVRWRLRGGASDAGYRTAGRAAGGGWRIELPEREGGPCTLEVVAEDGLGNTCPPVIARLRIPERARTPPTDKISDWAPIPNAENPLFWISRTEVTNELYRRFYEQYSSEMVARARKDLGRRLRTRTLDADVRRAFEASKEEPPRAPVVQVTSDVARLFCWWAGGRLPTVEEWRLAAGRALVPDARWPIYRDKPSGRLLATLQGKWSNFGRRGGRESPLMTIDALDPGAFGLKGMAGNVAEWVLTRKRGRVAGTMGGSIRDPYTNDTTGGMLDREPVLPKGGSLWDVGIRVLFDPRDR